MNFEQWPLLLHSQSSLLLAVHQYLELHDLLAKSVTDLEKKTVKSSLEDVAFRMFSLQKDQSGVVSRLQEQDAVGKTIRLNSSVKMEPSVALIQLIPSAAKGLPHSSSTLKVSATNEYMPSTLSGVLQTHILIDSYLSRGQKWLSSNYGQSQSSTTMADCIRSDSFLSYCPFLRTLVPPQNNSGRMPSLCISPAKSLSEFSAEDIRRSECASDSLMLSPKTQNQDGLAYLSIVASDEEFGSSGLNGNTSSGGVLVEDQGKHCLLSALGLVPIKSQKRILKRSRHRRCRTVPFSRK